MIVRLSLGDYSLHFRHGIYTASTMRAHHSVAAEPQIMVDGLGVRQAIDSMINDSKTSAVSKWVTALTF